MIYHCFNPVGFGDMAMYLNWAHSKAYFNNTSCDLYVYWTCGPEDLYHPDDPETAAERMSYYHNFYNGKDSVHVHHLFNVDERDPKVEYIKQWKIVLDDHLQELKDLTNENVFSLNARAARIWTLDERRLQPTQKDKIVFWRPTFNIEPARAWKLGITDDDYIEVVNTLRSQGCHVVELCYRTPISEALYHCSTAEYAFFYDGMWSSMITMLFKPSAVVGKSTIAMYNSLASVPVRTKNELNDIFIEFWRSKRNWERRRSNNHETMPREPYPKLSFEYITGRQYLRQYRNRMKAVLNLCIEKNVDWTRANVFHNEHEMTKYLGVSWVE